MAKKIIFVEKKVLLPKSNILKNWKILKIVFDIFKSKLFFYKNKKFLPLITLIQDGLAVIW